MINTQHRQKKSSPQIIFKMNLNYGKQNRKINKKILP